LDTAWTGLMKAERDRSQVINETIRDIKNALRKSFADKANDFALALNTLGTSISALEGEVEDQLEHTKEISKSLAPLDEYLNLIAAIDEQCAEANIEENDFTTYTYDELEYELSLVRSSVSKKLAFLENQMVARNMTNLTPIQLEEFESVFRHFDRDLSNSLAELEFSAALASLGLVYDDEEMHEKFRETSGGRDYVTFEQFIRFMVDETEDQNTAEQVFESFKEVADGKVCSCGLQITDHTLTNYSPMSLSLTFDTLSSPTKSLKTSFLQCLNTRDQICRRTAISRSTTTLPTWNGT
jgi:Ca2+-binding EF-hand superfamily protein